MGVRKSERAREKAAGQVSKSVGLRARLNAPDLDLELDSPVALERFRCRATANEQTGTHKLLAYFTREGASEAASERASERVNE